MLAIYRERPSSGFLFVDLPYEPEESFGCSVLLRLNLVDDQRLESF